jgi:hypothetical protein
VKRRHRYRIQGQHRVDHYAAQPDGYQGPSGSDRADAAYTRTATLMDRLLPQATDVDHLRALLAGVRGIDELFAKYAPRNVRGGCVSWISPVTGRRRTRVAEPQAITAARNALDARYRKEFGT